MALFLLEVGAPPVSNINVAWLRQRIHALWEFPGSRADVSFHYCLDIIGCLVAGVILTVLFFCWNAYLSRVHAAKGSSTAWWQPPPLVPSSLWFRSNGRFLAILMVVLWTWSSFLANNLWVRGLPPCPSFLRLNWMPCIGLWGFIGSGKKSACDPGVLMLRIT